VTDIAREFSSYTCLLVPLSVKTTDGTDQPVVGKGMVKWTNTLTLSKVLYVFFFVKLLSINVIIVQLNCVFCLISQKCFFERR
jgi:hypothetical protein